MSGFYATIARYYDSEHHDKDEDLPLYLELADEYVEDDEPILIIGSGSGRILFALAEQGFTAHGIEIEPAMLERAQRKLEARPHLRDHIVFHAGDVLKVPLDQRFGLVIIPYNTLMHFHEQPEQLALLRRVRSWTKPGGALVIDLPNAGDAFAALDTEALTLERTFIDHDTGHLVMQQSVSLLDRAEQLMQVTWLYDALDEHGVVHRTLVPVLIRYFFRAEMQLLLSASGFGSLEFYGDFDRTPFEDGSPRMIVLAE